MGVCLSREHSGEIGNAGLVAYRRDSDGGDERIIAVEISVAFGLDAEPLLLCLRWPTLHAAKPQKSDPCEVACASGYEASFQLFPR